MPLYMCSKCGCVENTALGGFWMTQMAAHEAGVEHKPLCSEHNPEIGKWHGEFAKKSADGYLSDRSGYLYRPEEVAGYFKDRGPFNPITLPPARPPPAAEGG